MCTYSLFIGTLSNNSKVRQVEHPEDESLVISISQTQVSSDVRVDISHRAKLVSTDHPQITKQKTFSKRIHDIAEQQCFVFSESFIDWRLFLQSTSQHDISQPLLLLLSCFYFEIWLLHCPLSLLTLCILTGPSNSSLFTSEGKAATSFGECVCVYVCVCQC